MPRVGATGNLDSSCARRRERSADRDEETGRSDRTKKLTKKNAAPCQISLTKKVPYKAEGVFDVAGVFAGMFVLSIFVILIDMGVTLVERRLLLWRPAPADGRG